MMENVIFQTKSWLHVYSSYGRSPSSLNSFQFSEKGEYLSIFCYLGTTYNTLQLVNRSNEPLVLYNNCAEVENMYTIFRENKRCIE